MTGGQVTVPLVVRTANGGGLGFGAQHSQAVENWALDRARAEDRRAVDAGRRRRPDGLGDPQRRPGGVLRAQGPVRDARASRPRRTTSCRSARRAVAREGTDVTLVALASTVPTRAAPRPSELAERGHLGRGGRPALPGPARHGHRAGLGGAHLAAGRRRGEPVPGRLGRARSPRSSPTRASSCSTRPITPGRRRVRAAAVRRRARGAR